MRRALLLSLLLCLPGPARAEPGSEADLELVQLMRALVTSERDDLDPVVNRLVYVQSPEAPRLVAGLLSHPAPRVRRNAVWVLSILQVPATGPSLVRALDDSDPEVRRDAAFALPPVMGQAAAQPLAVHLSDPDRLVRLEVARALGKVATMSTATALAEALSRCGDDLELELALIDALGAGGGKAALKALRGRQEAGSEVVRLAALRALARLADPEARARLLSRLQADDPWQRVDAARILAEVPGDWAATALARSLADPAPKVRLAAAEALGAQGDARGLRHLVSVSDAGTERAGGPDAGQSAAAAAALERLRVPAERIEVLRGELRAGVDVLELARRLRAEGAPFERRVIEIAGALKNVPYLDSPLGEGAGVDPDPLVRWDAVDCLTYVEQVLAAAAAPEPERFLPALLDLRYTDGRPSFGGRNHLMMHQWIPANVEKGWLRDVAREIAGEAARTVEKTITDASWRASRGVDLALGPDEIPLGRRTLDVVPLERFEELMDRIPEGTVLVVVRKDLASRPYRVTHLGFVVHSGRRVVLRHAARGQRLRVVDEDLRVFLARNRKYTRWPVEGFALLAPDENRRRVAALPERAPPRADDGR